MQNGPQTDKFPGCCLSCPNKAKYRFCSPICSRMKAEAEKQTARELDKQEYDRNTHRLHYRHRHKRW